MNRFDPCLTWLGIESQDNRPLDFYQLLGIAPSTTDPAQISQAAATQAAKVSPHLPGEHKALAEQLLQQISAARDCLSDPQRKAAYDQRRSAKQPGNPRKLKRAKPLDEAPTGTPSAIDAKPTIHELAPEVDDVEPAAAQIILAARPASPKPTQIPAATASVAPVESTDAGGTSNRRPRILMASVIGGGIALSLTVLLSWIWSASSPSTGLVVNWPLNERHGSRIVMDGQFIDVPNESQFTIRCEPGPHHISVTRDGYEMYLHSFVAGSERQAVTIDAKPVFPPFPSVGESESAIAHEPSTPSAAKEVAAGSPPPGTADTKPNRVVSGPLFKPVPRIEAPAQPPATKPAVVAQQDKKTTQAKTASKTTAEKAPAAKAAEVAASTDKRSAEEKAEEEPWVLKVGGSWSGYNANQAVAPAFTKLHETPVRVFGVNSRSLFGDLKSGRFDVLVYSPQSRATLAEALQRAFPHPEVPPKQYLFGQFAVQVIVHPSNPVETLTYAQLQQAFSGQAKKWFAFGETQRLIQPVGEMESSKANEIFRREVMHDGSFSGGLKTFRGAVHVAAYVFAQPGAIGFCIVTDEPLQKVKVVPISAKADRPHLRPTREAVMSKQYPLTEELYLFTRNDGPAKAQEYCEFARGVEGAKAALSSALIPAVEHAEFVGKQRLAERKAKRGSYVAAVGNESAKSAVTSLATEFTKSEKATEVGYTTVSSAEGVKTFLAGDADILVLDDPLSGSAIAASKEDWGRVKPVGTVIGLRAVGVVINARNGTREFTTADLKAIWSGEVRRWPDTEQPIQMFALKSDNRVNLFLDDKFGACGAANVTRRMTADQVIRSVAGRPGSIGFVDLKEMGAPGSAVLATVVGKAPEPKPPSAQEMAPDYPLTWPVTVYRSSQTGNEAQRFVGFLEPKRLTPIAAKLGLFPPAPSP